MKSIDVYLCRKHNQFNGEDEFKEAVLDELLNSDYGANASAERLKEWVESSWQRRIRQTEKKIADDDLLCSISQYASPFDRMPSKIEMQAMNEIFKREYCDKAP